jgi:hypothetical protein
MALKKVAWKTEKDGNTIAGEFEYDAPETLKGWEDKIGEESACIAIEKSVDIFLQAYARRQATKEEDAMKPAEIAKAIPGLRITFSRREASDPVDKVMAQFGKLSDEKRAALLASLQQMLA